VADLKESGIEVLGLVSIFNYGFPETAVKFAEAGCPFISLCDFKTLAGEAARTAYISAEAKAKIDIWNADAKAWSDAFEGSNAQ